jgi:hypothetical protein
LKTRILLTGLAAVVAMAFSASSALAVTVRPPGTHTATSVGPVVFRVGALRATCEKSSFPIVVSSEGAVKGGGPATFTNCSDPGFGTDYIYSAPIQPELAFEGNGLNLTLRNLNLRVMTIQALCRFNVTGYESTTIPGVSPLSFSEFAFVSTPNLSNATMKLTSFENATSQKQCSNTVALNQPAALTAKYEYTPPLIVTK